MRVVRLRALGDAGRWWATACVAACILAVATTGALAVGGDGPQRAVTAGTPADLAGDVEPAETDATVRGAENDSFGKSVVPAGDVNGDGDADLLVGAPFNDSTGPRAGAAYLFFGPVTATEVSASDADVVMRAEGAGDWAGWSAAAGDLDGDGFSDVVVGAPLNDRDGRGAGAVYVVYGHAGMGGTMDLGEADAVLVGESPRDNAGLSVAVGDVRGSSNAAVLVGAPRNDAGGTDAGAAYVVTGDSSISSGSLASASVRVLGEAAGDMAGSSVAAAGDFDGDGDGDVVIGARDAGPESGGAAYVVTGANGTGSLSDASLRMYGAEDGDHAGWSVAGAGDTNGDGFDDVVVGAPTNDGGGDNAGAAYVVFGGDSRDGAMSLSGADRTLVGEQPGDRAGWSVAAAGSGIASCDGYDDVLVGAPRHDHGGTDVGAAYLVGGDDSPRENVDLADAGGRYAGGMAGALGGWSVAGGADVTGDGRADLLVGAPEDGEAGHHAGAVQLVEGTCSAGGGDGSSSEPEAGVERFTACVAPGVDEDVTNSDFEAEPAADSGEEAPTSIEWRFTTGSPDLDVTSSVVVERTDGVFERFAGGHNGTATVGEGTVVDRSRAWPCAEVGPGADELVYEQFARNGSAFERVIGAEPPAATAEVAACDGVDVTLAEDDYPYWLDLRLVNRSNPDDVARATVGATEPRVSPAPGLTGDRTVTVAETGYDPDEWTIRSAEVWSGYDWLDWFQHAPVAGGSMTDGQLQECIHGAETTSEAGAATGTATTASESGSAGASTPVEVPFDPVLVLPLVLGAAVSVGLLVRELR